MERSPDDVGCGCRDFLARFSDYRDGLLGPGEAAAFDDHLEGCPVCRRYRDVLDRAVSVLRQNPVPGAEGHFRARLQHRLLSEVNERKASLGRIGSGAPLTVTAVLAVAFLIAVAAWWPWLGGRSQDPGEGGRVADVTGAATSSRESAIRVPSPGLIPPAITAQPAPEDLWEFSTPLLYEYSPLRRGQQSAAPVQSGLQ